MGKLKHAFNKSPQLLNDQPETTTTSKTKTKQKNAPQDFLHQSVTILALKSATNVTIAPDLAHPHLFLGIFREDIPLIFSALIGSSFIVLLALLTLIIWKCCCSMTILTKKKEYWLEPKDKSILKTRIPTVAQSNSIVFLGLKRSCICDSEGDKSVEDCLLIKNFPEGKYEDLKEECYIEAQHLNMSSTQSSEIISELQTMAVEEHKSLPEFNGNENSVSEICSKVSQSSVMNPILNPHSPKSSVASLKDIIVPNVIINCDSPALLHREYYSSSFDQHSLYSCESQIGSECNLKACNLRWSNFSLRPSSTAESYYDIFQKSSFCKKKKNRMRSDIAAAIALNRSQSFHFNKDTDSLVENEVEIILDERTSL